MLIAPKRFCFITNEYNNFGFFESGPNTSCSESRLPMTQLYIGFQSNVNFSPDSCIGYHKM